MFSDVLFDGVEGVDIEAGFVGVSFRGWKEEEEACAALLGGVVFASGVLLGVTVVAGGVPGGCP